MSQQIVVVNFNDAIATSNNTQQTIQYYTVTQNSSGYFTANIIARRRSDGATKIWKISAVYKRETGNTSLTYSILDTLGSIPDLSTLLFCTATVDTSGADARMRVSGLIGTDIDWYGEAVGQEMQIS